MAIAYESIAEALGIDPELINDENAEELILAAIAELQGTEETPAEEEEVPVSEETASIAASLRGELREFKLNDLVRDGRISRHTKIKLLELFNGIGFSKDNNQFDKLFKILQENRPLSLGQKSGAQVSVLQKTENKANPLVDDAIQRRIAAGYKV